MTAPPATTELTGFGLAAALELTPDADRDPATADLVRRALDDHGVLVLRGLHLDNARYRDFAGAFGTREAVFPAAHRDPGWPEIRLQSNVAGEGVAAGGEYWHADGPLTEVPTALTFLLCERAPADGGETLFADMRRALDLLDPADRERAGGALGRYPCREIAVREMRDAGVPPEEQAAKLAELRDLTHPVVRTHPRTGRPALYLNQQWMTAVVGEPDDALLQRLYAAATAPGNVYRHRWRPGDLLLWDNAAVMHRALPPGPGSLKTTRRITIAGAPVPSPRPSEAA
ncbi:TauD/TfdA dioxygenase family protein [Kitasatospora phosalacinea]|uniref:TauD/TfdA dioxygenase family protein n=1 Tax=Kitasatospora phosalacinea TaxID=2065 RepID=UPI00068F0BD5|nr:TauD/TfdA family dioxygenase [Kitasatospora phosalacinea]